MAASSIVTPPVHEPDGKDSTRFAALRALLRNPLFRSGMMFALLLSGVFRLAAFIRETYVARQFGLSTATDAYYGLQQLPLSVATFMFGAFALAFAPAYSEGKRRSGEVSWLPGLLFHATLAGLALSAVTAGIAPLILRTYVSHADAESLATLYILSACYLPVIYLGIWTSMLNATGRPVRAMTMAALPYLIMTGALIVICEVAGPRLLSLPLSMAAGFWVMGAAAAYKIWRTVGGAGPVLGLVWPLRYTEFRRFSKQMVASAAENIGFAGNQLLMIYFFGLMGTGEVTANNYALRIGLLANGLITQPIAQLAQSKFCTAPMQSLRNALSGYLALIAGIGAVAALSIYLLRGQIVALLYLHGRFTSNDAGAVTVLIGPWVVYFLVLSVNTVLSRYLFVIRQGKRYAIFMLGAYVFTNVTRALWCAVDTYAPAIIWCAVIGEGAAMMLSLRACYRAAPEDIDSRIAVAVP